MKDKALLNTFKSWNTASELEIGTNKRSDGKTNVLVIFILRQKFNNTHIMRRQTRKLFHVLNVHLIEARPLLKQNVAMQLVDTLKKHMNLLCKTKE